MMERLSGTGRLERSNSLARTEAGKNQIPGIHFPYSSDLSLGNNNNNALFIEKYNIHYLYMHVFCVFFPFILDIKFVGRTSRGHTGGKSHRQEEGHTGFLILLSAVRALIFLARRIQPFLSLVNREVEFCVLTI